jgi:hypothetical protein
VFRNEERAMKSNSQNVEFKSSGNAEASNDFRADGDMNARPARSKQVALELPPAGAMRWGVRSKAAVVAAVRGGVLTLEQACERYALSTSEYFTWESGLDSFGLEGLALAGRRARRRNYARSTSKK